MLTAEYNMEPLLNSYSLGLAAIFDEVNERVMLIVKAPKEYILTAKVNGGFDIFIVPPDNEKIHITTLCSAFLDAPDSPLVIITPMFNTILSIEILRLLKSDKFSVHFFDINNREMLGYECSHEYSKQGKNALEHMTLIEHDFSLFEFTVNDISYENVLRDEKNDFISIKFGKPTMPDDFVRIDATFLDNNYHGALHNEFGLGGVGLSKLIIEEPGAYQERDIALCLERVFRGDEIYLNPHNDKEKNREEIADLMVVHGNNVLLIQAKDSPNTQNIISNKLERKISTSRKHFDKALAQMQGAVKYFNNGGALGFYIGDKRYSLDMTGKKIVGVILLKEMFVENYEGFSSQTLMLSKTMDTTCIFLEYTDLHQMTFNTIEQPAAFFDLIDKIFKEGSEHGVLPKLRIF